jgi:hypothetical protein
LKTDCPAVQLVMPRKPIKATPARPKKPPATSPRWKASKTFKSPPVTWATWIAIPNIPAGVVNVNTMLIARPT